MYKRQDWAPDFLTSLRLCGGHPDEWTHAMLNAASEYHTSKPLRSKSFTADYVGYVVVESDLKRVVWSRNIADE